MRSFADLTPRGQLRRLRALAQSALASWGRPTARLRLLNHGENTVYGVGLPGEPERHVLRLHRSDYHPIEDLRAEATWLEHLRSQGIATPLPERVGGDAVVIVATDGVPGARHTTLLAKTEGRIHSSTDWGPARARRVGRLLARMHRAAESYQPPPGFSRRVLDAEGIVGPTASWGDPLAEPLLTPTQREVMAWGRDRIREELARLPRSPDHWGLAHTDLHYGNVLFADGEAKAIDFDDLAFSWYINDLTVNLVPLRWQDPAAAEALLAGYRSVRDVSDEDLAPLGALHCARRLTAVAWVRSRADVPRLLASLPRRIDFAVRTLSAWRGGADPLEVRP